MRVPSVLLLGERSFPARILALLAAALVMIATVVTVAGADASGTVTVYLGSPLHDLIDAGTYKVGKEPGWIGIDDLNGDGIPDLVVTDPESGKVAVLIGLGDGRFDEATLSPLPEKNVGGLERGALPFAAIRDMTGDGVPDLVVLCRDSASSELVVFEGHGDGTFSESAPTPLDDHTAGLALEDIDGDGCMDLIASHLDFDDRNLENELLTVRMGLEDGGFSEPVVIDTLGSPALLVEDFNVDGILDLAATHWFSGVFVYPGNGDGTFGTPARACTGLAPLFLTTGDLDGDTRPDLVVSSLFSGTTVLDGNESGLFVEPDTTAFEDLLTLDWLIGLISGMGDDCCSRTQLEQILQELDVDYAIDSTSYGCRSWSTKGLSGPIRVADLDGDGALDIVSLNLFIDGLIEYRWGGETGIPEHGQSIAQNVQPWNLAVDDFNGDGIMDFAVVGYGTPFPLGLFEYLAEGTSRSTKPSGPPPFKQWALSTVAVAPQGNGLDYADPGWGLDLRLLINGSAFKRLDYWTSLGFRVYPGTDSMTSIDRKGRNITVERTETEWSFHWHMGIQLGSRSHHALFRPRFGLGLGFTYFGTEVQLTNKAEDVTINQSFDQQFRPGWRASVGLDVAVSRKVGLNLEAVYDHVWWLDQLPGSRGADGGGRFLGWEVGVAFLE